MSNKLFFNSQENKHFLGAYKPENLRMKKIFKDSGGI